MLNPRTIVEPIPIRPVEVEQISLQQFPVDTAHAAVSEYGTALCRQREALAIAFNKPCQFAHQADDMKRLEFIFSARRPIILNDIRADGRGEFCCCRHHQLLGQISLGCGSNAIADAIEQQPGQSHNRRTGFACQLGPLYDRG